jgi:putative transposase
VFHKRKDCAAFLDLMEEAGGRLPVRLLAWCLMPDHVHTIIRKHKHQAEEMLENSQECSRLRLRSAGVRTNDHPAWDGPGWKVFLDTPTDIRRTIQYIEQNPVRWRLPCQRWSFVTEYDGWPQHPGHSPSSPYARYLRDK